MSAHNPHTPPVADDGYNNQLLDTPNQLSIGAGWLFWRDAFWIIKNNWGGWLGAGLIYLVIVMVLSYLDASIILGVLSQLMIVGFAYKAHLQVNGYDNSIGDIFAGFSMNVGRQIGLYVAILVISMLILGMIAIGFFGLIGMRFDQLQQDMPILSVFVLLALAALMPIAMMMWFAPILIGVHDLGIIQAMKLSFGACLKNILPFLVFGLCFVLFAVIASIPFMLGWLILLPVFTLTYYTSYRQILTA